MNMTKPSIYIQSSALHIKDALIPLIEENIPDLQILEDKNADFQVFLNDDKTITLSQVKSDKNEIFQAPIKIMVLIQHIQNIYSRNQNIHIGPYIFDYSARTLKESNHTLHLTEKEAEVLKYLDNNRDKGITRDDLLKDVWGYADGIDTHTIETHIYRLRQKIEKDSNESEILITGDNGYQLVGNL